MKFKFQNTLYLPVLFSLILILGILIGFSLKNDSPVSPQHSSANKILYLINLISDKYVEKIEKETLIDKSIESILNELDPHSNYIKPKKFKVMEEELSGHFYGIGVQFRLFRDSVLVIMPIENGPSEMLGIKPGDRIIAANGVQLTGDSISNDKVMSVLKGALNTFVDVQIKRPFYNEILEFKIKRANIPTYSVETSFMHSKNTGYINITKFSATTYDEVVSSVENLKKRGLKNLIIDLRYNGGGYLSAATSVVDEFLEAGNIIVYTDGDNQERIVSKSTHSTKFKDINLVVLISEFSASASEILAGAIQDNDRGLIIGRRSFGKGLVQEQFVLGDNSAIRLTVAKYYTPSGRSIQKPYNNGDNSAYYHEVIERYKNGEMDNKDSIKNIDSLKFYTKGGKIVYGGGGISPDVFVAIDTNKYFYFLNALISKSLMLDYSFVLSLKPEFNKFNNFDDYNKNFPSKIAIDGFRNFIKKSEIEFDNEAFINMESEILNRLKAYVARNLFSTSAYYQILLTEDKAFKEALKSFN